MKPVKDQDVERRRYHHGDLKAAILASSEALLKRDGVAGLTLRAAAREAGVSHAAPKNHFGDLRGLLSELAAAGFRGLREQMLAGGADSESREARLHAAARSYVRFAAAHPALFLLMFRGERLDMAQPALREAADALLAVLAGTPDAAAPPAVLSEDKALEMILAWSQVHGLAMLLIDGRLKPIVGRLPPGADEESLLAKLLAQPRSE